MFSFEFCEISKNTFSYRTPLVAASDFLLLLRNWHKTNINCPLIAARFKLFLVKYADMIYHVPWIYTDHKKSMKYTFDQSGAQPEIF